MTKFWEDRPGGSVAAVGQIANGGGGAEQRRKCREGRLGFGFDRNIGLLSVRWLPGRPIERGLSSRLG